MNCFTGTTKNNNKGETLVEVMVSFIVLLITLALFSHAISFAGNASNNSIDQRRAHDKAYTDLHIDLDSESFPGEKAAGTTNSGIIPDESTRSFTISGTDGSIELKAYKYESDSSVYWVFR